jgi:hypothetical protein
MNQDFILFSKKLVLWNQDFGEKKFQNISKISKICTRKTHFSPQIPQLFFQKSLPQNLGQ